MRGLLSAWVEDRCWRRCRIAGGAQGFGNLQIALFAAFGGFASLIVASFGGSRRDKIVAHLGLAVTGSIALIIGTAVSGIEWLAVLVTIPVALGIFFAGVAGPNTAPGIGGAACSISARMRMRSPGRPGTWPSSAASPGGGRSNPAGYPR